MIEFIEFTSLLRFFPSFIVLPLCAVVALYVIKIVGNVVRFVLDLIPFA